MTKKYLPIILIFTSLLIACAGRNSQQTPVAFLDYVPHTPWLENEKSLEPLGGKTAFDYFRDEKIAAGINLGNTLDAHSGGYASETVWGNPLVNQQIMNGIKAAGFDIIRIPITWMGDVGHGPEFRIDRARLFRVAQVVDMAHGAGLKVIINMHHDGSTDTSRGDLGWLSIRQASRNQEEFNRITAQFVNMWKQIATYFRNYGDWLIFEGFNELHDGGWGSSGDVSHFLTLARWNQLFIDAVRLTGGNNEQRYLIVSAYCQDRQKTLSVGFMLPTDTADNRLIVSFHYYDPYQFGIEGTRSAWGSPSDKQKVDDDFAPFKQQFIDKNIQVIVGECGAVLQLYPDNREKEIEAARSRREYLPHVFGTAKKYGMVPLYWDNGLVRGNGEKFGLFDRRTGQPNSPESDTLIKLMINAVKS
jgi:endoglucanase